MNNILTAYEEKFEAILSKKKVISKEYSVRMFYLNIAISFTIILTVFLTIGYILTNLKNYNFVAYSIGAAVFGSFLFSMIVREQYYQKEYKLDYSIFICIVNSMLRNLLVISSVLSILFFYVFDRVSNNADVILMLTISTIILFWYYFIENVITNRPKKNMETIAFIIIVHQYYMIVFHTQLFPDLLWGSIIWTVILLLLFMIRDHLTRHNQRFGLNVYLKIGIYLFMIAFFNIRIPTLTYNIDIREDSYISYEPNIIEESTLIPLTYSAYSDDGIRDEYYWFEGTMVIKYYDEHYNYRYNVIENEYINDTCKFYSDEGYYHLECIAEMDNEFHRITFGIVDFDLVEQNHEKSNDSIEYSVLGDKSRGVYKILSPLKTYQTDRYIVIKTKLGYFVYSKEYQFLGHIFDENILYSSTLLYDEEDLYLSTYISTSKEYGLSLVDDEYNLVDIYSESLDAELYEAVFIKNQIIYYSRNSVLYRYDRLTEKLVQLDDGFYLNNEITAYISGIGKLDHSSYSNDYAYNNGYVLIEKNSEYELTVASIDDFVNDNEENFIYINPINASKDKKDQTQIIKGFIATEDRFIVNDSKNIYSYNLLGEFDEYLEYSNPMDFENVYINENVLTTLFVDYYSYRFGDYSPINISRIDSSDIVTERFRTEYRSYLSCSNPYGCTEYNPTNYSYTIYIEMVAIIMLVILPNKKPVTNDYEYIEE